MINDNISRIIRWYKGPCSFEIIKWNGKKIKHREEKTAIIVVHLKENKPQLYMNL